MEIIPLEPGLREVEEPTKDPKENDPWDHREEAFTFVMERLLGRWRESSRPSDRVQ